LVAKDLTKHIDTGSRARASRDRAPREGQEIAMLVLSRKLGEKIVIGENIVITVVKIDRNQIRLGIEAPHEVPVYREEIAPGYSEVMGERVASR
jgi:carbon storage regulator